MNFCSMADRLYAAVPLRRFRDWLIRAHMEGCPACQARLLSREEARDLLVGPDQVGGTRELWARLAGQLACEPAELRPRPAAGVLVWRWAAGAAVAAVVALSGFWLLRQAGRPDLAAASNLPARFEIAYVNVDGKPAQTFVYQPQGTDTVFVWASKTSSTGGER